MDVIQKEKITKPDLPFDLTTLQRECNKYFGYSAKQTLDYAQSLYEKKLIILNNVIRIQICYIRYVFIKKISLRNNSVFR